MAYLKVTNERTGKPVKFVSKKARDSLIRDMLRKQARLVSGKTVVDSRIAEPYDGKPRGFECKKNIDYRALEKQAENLERLVKKSKI